MTTESAHPADLREHVDSLLDRLARIDAGRVALAGVTDSLGRAQASPTLASVVETLERDLTLAAREADRVRDRANRA